MSEKKREGERKSEGEKKSAKKKSVWVGRV